MDSPKVAQQSVVQSNENPSFLDDEDVLFNVKKIISSVIANRDAWPFREAVKEKDAPNYFEIIKTPMDLALISQKIEEKLYTDFHQLECDLRLIVNNSEQYNGEFNGFTTNSKAVWRLFRRLTKKYLNQDLSVEDQEAFIFPPRINYAKKRDASSIDTKKKLKKQKKSSKFQALELMYKATQDSIESTFQRFAFSPASDSENKQLNENLLPKKYQFATTTTAAANKPVGFYNEEFANLANYSYQDGFYTEKNRNENLVFKSLNEWNKQLDNDGVSIILPNETIFVNHSPVDEVNWLTNFPNDQPHYKTVFNELLFQKPIDGQLHNGQLILNRHSSHCKKEKSSRGKKSSRTNSRRRTKESRTSNGRKNAEETSEDCKMSVDEQVNDQVDEKVDLKEKSLQNKNNLVEKNSLASDRSTGKADRIERILNKLQRIKEEPLQDDDLEAKEQNLVEETKQIDLNKKTDGKNSQENGQENGQEKDLKNGQKNGQDNDQANSHDNGQANSHENHQGKDPENSQQTSSQADGQENGESKQKKRLIIKLSKLNNDWKPINLNGSHERDSNQSGSSSDSSSDSSCSSSCSCDSDSDS